MARPPHALPHCSSPTRAVPSWWRILRRRLRATTTPSAATAAAIWETWPEWDWCANHTRTACVPTPCHGHGGAPARQWQWEPRADVAYPWIRRAAAAAANAWTQSYGWYTLPAEPAARCPRSVIGLRQRCSYSTEESLITGGCTKQAT